MTAPRFELLSQSLLDRIEKQDRHAQAEWLFLSESEEFKGRWSVEALWPEWFFDFEEFVGHYRTVSPANLDAFLSYSQDMGYHVVFEDPPESILRAYEDLALPPPFALNSDLENTVQGLLPWQVVGFNKLVRDESLKGGLVVWDTGTGKTALIASALLWHGDYGHPYDLALVVVKKNNKTDMQRKLKRLADIDSYVIEGTPKQRLPIYEEIETKLLAGESVVAVTNYERFKNDKEFFEFIIGGRDCIFFWDEMPTRLSNRTTKLYEAIKRCLWNKFEAPKSGNVPRAKWMRQWDLSATPIENSPDGLFNQIRLMAPGLLGLVEHFNAQYVAFKNQISGRPERWTRLDKLEGIIEHMTHRVSREDPEVAEMFPEVMEDTLIIDWDPRDKQIYDRLVTKAGEMIEEADLFEDDNILALIQIMQMVCDAPSMIVWSAENREAWEDLDDEEAFLKIDAVKGSEIAVKLLRALGKAPTDDRHTKLDTLHEILTEKHPNEKVLVYMTWATYGPEAIAAKLDEWGISYVIYAGTDKQRQLAKDSFREDPSIRVFLSSDKGSDSIDLPEAAVGINYNLPWTWTRKRQRQGRNDRVDSKLETTWWYDLIMANSVEERKREIIATKYGYHKALFDGKAVEDSMSAKLTKDDLVYILTGRN